MWHDGIYSFSVDNEPQKEGEESYGSPDHMRLFYDVLLLSPLLLLIRLITFDAK